MLQDHRTLECLHPATKNWASRGPGGRGGGTGIEHLAGRRLAVGKGIRKVERAQVAEASEPGLIMSIFYTLGN